jgi:flagellar basal-body rod protein FlgG
MPDGHAYTRDGSFQMDAQGRMVTSQGNPVQPTIRFRRIVRHHHQPAGPGSVTLPGSTTPTTADRSRADALHQQGRIAADRRQPVHRHPGVGAPQDGASPTPTASAICSSPTRAFNRQVVTEISDLIARQRAYEMNAKVVSAADQIDAVHLNMPFR